MANDELSYLKSLITALQAKVDALENKTKTTVGNVTESTKAVFEPAKELRMILVGPPGAGMFPLLLYRYVAKRLGTLSDAIMICCSCYLYFMRYLLNYTHYHVDFGFHSRRLRLHIMRIVRQRHSSPNDSGQVQRLSPRYWRHAPRASNAEDRTRRGGEKDHGRRRSCV